MKNKLTEKEILMVQELAAQMKEEAGNALSLEKNLQNSLASRVEGLDTSVVISDICAGVDEFEAAYKKAQDGDINEIIINKLTLALKDKEDLEKYQILTELFETFSRQVNGLCEEELQAEVDFKTKSEITQKDLQELTIAVAEYISEFALLSIDTEPAKAMLNLLGDEMVEELKDVVWNEQAKYYMALSIYILKVQGKIVSIPADVTAKEIGISAAAFMKSESIKLAGILGKIPWSKVLEKLKVVAAVALALLAAAVVIATSFIVGETVFLLSQAILGFSIIGTIVSVGLALIAGGKTADALVDLSDQVSMAAEVAKEKILEWYEYFSKWLKEKAIPELKTYWNHMKTTSSEWIKKEKKKFKEKKETEKQTENESEKKEEEVILEEEDAFHTFA